MAMMFLLAITLVVNAASVVVCSWLLWNVGSRTGGRLLPAQLVNLALADVLYSTASIWTTIDAIAGRDVHTTMFSFERFALATSVCMEFLIAVGFFALFWGFSGVMRVLERSTCFAWWVSLLLMALITEFGDPHFFVEKWMFVIAGCNLSVIYVVTFLRSCCYPLREAQRAERIVLLFLLTFVITFVPFIIFANTPDEQIGYTCLGQNGILNVLVYRCNSRFSGTVWSNMTDDTGSSLMLWGVLSSRPVRFRASPPEVATVPAEQREARQESEREIVALEEAQAAAAEEDRDRP